MMAWVQGKAAIESRRLIPAGHRDGSVGELVPDESDEQRRNQIERIDDELQRVGEQHDSKYRPRQKGPGRFQALLTNESRWAQAAATAISVRTPTETTEAFASSPWTALFPRRMPPSSMISEPTTMSPNTLPVARISRRPVVLTLPWIDPPTTTLRPVTLPLTRPCSPTDRSPSVVRSPFISPSNRMLDVDCSRPSSLIWLLSTVSATMGAASRGDLLSNTKTS